MERADNTSIEHMPEVGRSRAWSLPWSFSESGYDAGLDSFADKPNDGPECEKFIANHWGLVAVLGGLAAKAGNTVTFPPLVRPRKAETAYGFHQYPPTAAVSRKGLWAKRTIDIFVAGLAGLLLLPLLLIVAAAIFVTLGRPIVFSHERIGQGGRRFKCYKFRTMRQDGDKILADYLAKTPDAKREWEETQKLKSDPRVTPLSAVLRRTSIDELPQLWNVLCGEMSCVGPRPVTAAELARYGDRVKFYISVRPGITGIWQVSGRSSTTYEQRVHLDTFYVRSRSLLLDVKILFLTIPALLKLQDSA